MFNLIFWNNSLKVFWQRQVSLQKYLPHISKFSLYINLGLNNGIPPEELTIPNYFVFRKQLMMLNTCNVMSLFVLFYLLASRHLYTFWPICMEWLCERESEGDNNIDNMLIEQIQAEVNCNVCSSCSLCIKVVYMCSFCATDNKNIDVYNKDKKTQCFGVKKNTRTY